MENTPKWGLNDIKLPLPTVKFKKLHPDAIIPQRQTEGSAGLDLHTIDEDYWLFSMGICLFKTGLAIELPSDFEAQIRTRSGLALKRGLIVLNSPATIDSDYRGEIGIIIQNVSNQTQYIKKGTRIAQMVINKLPKVNIQVVEELNETKRNTSGYGSTGT
jgi:dUTP pyrophosphatase